MDAPAEPVGDITIHIGRIALFDKATHVLQDQAVRVKIDHVVTVVIDLKHLLHAFGEGAHIINDVDIVRTDVALGELQRSLSRALVDFAENQIDFGHGVMSHLKS